MFSFCITNCNSLSRNDKINPQATEWLDTDYCHEVNPQNNGFYFMVGFHCSSNKLPITEGKLIIKLKNEYVQASKDEKDKDYNFNCFENEDFESINDNLDFTNEDYDINDLTEQKDFIKMLELKLSYLIKRFYHLDKFEQYTNTAIPDNDLFIYFNGILEVKLLNLALIYLEFFENENSALDKLLNQISISNHLLTHYSSLEGKFLAMELAKLDYIFIDKLLTSFTPANDEFYKSISQNLSVPEISWDEVFIRQYQNRCKNLEKMILNINEKKRSDKLSKLYPQFVNDHYKLTLYLINISKISANDYYKKIKNTPNFEPTELEKLFNPIKRLYQTNDSIEYTLSYIAQQHYLQGFINLLNLKLLVLHDNLQKHQVDELVSQMSNTLNNPFTLENINFDHNNSIIYYEGPFSKKYEIFRKVRLNF